MFSYEPAKTAYAEKLRNHESVNLDRNPRAVVVEIEWAAVER